MTSSSHNFQSYAGYPVKFQLDLFQKLLGIDKWLIQGFGGIAVQRTIDAVDIKQIDIHELKAMNELANIGFRRNGSQSLVDASGWNSLLIEFDDENISKDNQIEIVLNICKTYQLPLPTCGVDTGNKSIHFYWAFNKQITIEQGNDLQLRLLNLFASYAEKVSQALDFRFKSIVQVSRLPGFKHSKTGNESFLIDMSRVKCSFEELDKAIPKECIANRIDNVAVPLKAKKELPGNNQLRINVTSNKSVESVSSAFLDSQISESIAQIENSKKGQIHDSIIKASLRLGSLIPHGLSYDLAFQKLESAVASRVGVCSKKESGAIKYGLEKGALSPRILAKDIYRFDANYQINEKYINPKLFNSFPDKKILLIKSAMNTGKTTALVELIREMPKDTKILIISHRIALVDSWYEELSNDGFYIYKDKEIRDRRRYITSIDSLKLLFTQGLIKYDLIILDEIDQLLEHLHQGKTDVKNDRVLAIQIFFNLMRNSKQVICPSGTLANKEISYFESLLGKDNIAAIKNTAKPAQKEFIKIDSEELIYQEMKKQIEDGKKIAIASNSKEKIDIIISKLKIEYPDKSIESITSKNSSQSGLLYQALVDKSDLMPLGTDILGYSPSISTGCDISRKHFDCVFGIFPKCNSLGGKDIMQSVVRVRNPISNKVYIWVGEGSINNGYIDKDEIIKEIELYSDFQSCRSSIALNQMNEEEYNVHLNYVADSIIQKNKSLRNLNNDFWQLAEKDKHIISEYQFDNELVKSIKDGKIKSEKAKNKEIKEKLRLEQIDKIANSEILPLHDVDMIQKKEHKEEKELNALSKYFYSRNTGDEDIDKKQLYWYEFDKGKKACSFIELLQMPYELAGILDEWEIQKGNKVINELKYRVLSKSLIDEFAQIIEKSFFVHTVNNIEHKVFSDKSLKENNIIDFLEEHEQDIIKLFGFKPDRTKPLKTASSFLGLFGLEVENLPIKIKGKKYRVYKVVEISQKRHDKIFAQTITTKLDNWHIQIEKILMNDLVINNKELLSDFISRSKNFIKNLHYPIGLHQVPVAELKSPTPTLPHSPLIEMINNSSGSSSFLESL